MQHRGYLLLIAIAAVAVLCLGGAAIHLLHADAGPRDIGSDLEEPALYAVEAGKNAEAEMQKAKKAEAKKKQAAAATKQLPDTGIEVFVETGHGIDENGKWDTGAVWTDGDTTYEEAKIMLPIARATVKYLRASGITVHTDADDGNKQNLFATLDFLDKHRDVKAFINLHCDYDKAESGTLGLYRTEEQKALAEAVNKGVHQEVDIPDRGFDYREDLDTLTSDKVHCPAVLYETGAIKADNKLLTEDYDRYGKGIARGICAYLGTEFAE